MPMVHNFLQWPLVAMSSDQDEYRKSQNMWCVSSIILGRFRGKKIKMQASTQNTNRKKPGCHCHRKMKAGTKRNELLFMNFLKKKSKYIDKKLEFLYYWLHRKPIISTTFTFDVSSYCFRVISYWIYSNKQWLQLFLYFAFCCFI